MNVLMNVMSGRGHTQASLGIAKLLRSRGHQVTFLCWPDAVSNFRAYGFPTVLYAEQVLSELSEQAALEKPSVRPLRSMHQNMKSKKFDLFESYLNHILNGELDEKIISCEPDVFVFDNFLWANALRAMSLKIPVVSLSIPMAFCLNSHIPPVTSARKVSGQMLERFNVWCDWMWVEAKSFWINVFNSKIQRKYRHPYRFHHLTHVYRRIAKQSGMMSRRNRDFVLSEFGPRLIVPEIVCSPLDLQFPMKAHDGRVFFGSYVDLDRPEVDEPLDDLNPEMPWIYCSLGTESNHYPYSKDFFRAVVEASRLRPQWQWILSAPDGALETGQELPSNLSVSNWWPQIHVLRKAAVMVTHGGINSILEGIECKVPMVIVPGSRDQPGNAARAEACGIAQCLQMKRIRATELIDSVNQCLHSSRIQESLVRIHASISDGHDVNDAIDLIESVALKQQVDRDSSFQNQEKQSCLN